ncbi:MAG TPA: cation diffusion facilitator family transporter [Solirubrobacterales bacterium]|nr:cation diffusion facilitator family transporter [Solirubrobacterales bacterium]
MAHAHPHGGRGSLADTLGARRADTRRRLWIALAINVAMLAAEAIGGVITGSLALLADAGHVLSDVGAIGLGLAAGGLASLPGGPRRTFGYQRTEVIAALVNGIALVVIAVLVAAAAIDRLGDAPEVEGAGVLALGALGLAGNVAATCVLARGEREDLNLEGVLRHSVADALGSLGVIVSGAVIVVTGWDPIDPLVGLAIAALILASSARLIAEPINVLMEAAPAGMDAEALAREICELEGVRAVHDLHVWTVTSGFEALSAHVVVSSEVDRDLVRRQLEVMLRRHHDIDHTTLQNEEEAPPELLDVEGG